MSFLRNYLNKIKPNFEEGGKLHAFRSVFDGFDTSLCRVVGHVKEGLKAVEHRTEGMQLATLLEVRLYLIEKIS